MKALSKAFIRKTARINLFWFFYRQCRVLSEYFLLFYRHAQAARDGSVLGSPEFIRRSFPDLTVRNGPFKGMQYPSSKASGSALLPKLLGSYESELHPLFAKILANTYTDIVDIGCAEGYYAIGLGMKFPDAKIHAFDVDRKAQHLCRQMAELNGISNRLSVGAFCDETTLLNMKFNGRALIISDCEGYEKSLFTPKVAQFLAPHDLLIEVHDLEDPTISTTLKSRFEKTHHIEVIESVDDARKVRHYNFAELAPYNTRERFALLAENRMVIMEWFYLTPKVLA